MNEYQHIHFYPLYPQDKQNGVKRSIKSHFPACQLKDISIHERPLSHGELPMGGGSFSLNRRGRRAGLPLQSLDTSQLGSIFCHMGANAWLELSFSPDLTNHKLERRVQKGLKNLGMSKQELDYFFQIDQPQRQISDLQPVERARYKALYQQHTGREKSFQVALSLWSQQEAHDVYVQDTKASVERVMERDNYIYLRKKRWVKWGIPLSISHSIPSWHQQMTWSHTELANLLHVPDGNDPIYQQEGDRPFVVTSDLPQAFSKGVRVGVLDDGSERAICIPYQQWTYMGFGAGQRVMGKVRCSLK